MGYYIAFIGGCQSPKSCAYDLCAIGLGILMLFNI